MLNVFLTVDTEIWPFSPGWPNVPLPPSHSDFSSEMSFYIYGETRKGSFGVPFQLECLAEHGLKATYFVESLFASVAGLERLKDIISLIEGHGQEVQLHAHTEWLGEIADPALPHGFRQHIRQYSKDEQALIIGRAARNLRNAAARGLCAFRAGNFGANFDTLRALRTHGIKFDSSLNQCRLGSSCAIDAVDLLTQPKSLEGVYEFPLSFFSDYPHHYRQAQLCACSFQEISQALLLAWQEGWYAFVILMHGSELMGECKGADIAPRPNRIVVNRFTRLCRFLAENSDKFQTVVFGDVDSAAIPEHAPLPPLRSAVHLTAWRMLEQVAGRFV
jgi:hypothetical protein